MNTTSTTNQSAINANLKPRFDGLDGIRTFACIGIVAMHVLANIQAKPSENWITETLIPWFTDFTLLFFIVSAFGMCCGYYTKIKERSISLDDFYKKRYSKILPFFALLVAIDIMVSPSWESVWEAYADITLAFGFTNYPISVIGVGWFLGTIFVFYIIFPWFVFLLDNKKRAWIVWLMAVAMHLIMQYDFHTGDRQNILWTMPFLLSGGLIYLYRGAIINWIERFQWLMLAICIIATVGFFLVPTSTITTMALFCIWVIYAIGAKDKILKNRFTTFFSAISMEVYLCHMVFFRVIEMAHLERLIHNYNVLYIVSFLAVLIGAIIFSWVVKNMLFKTISK